MHLKSKKMTHYVSKIDEFFSEFDKTQPLSDSQQAEIKKYLKIYELRDKQTAHLETKE
jgi:hypothetical protein